MIRGKGVDKKRFDTIYIFVCMRLPDSDVHIKSVVRYTSVAIELATERNGILSSILTFLDLDDVPFFFFVFFFP